MKTTLRRWLGAPSAETGSRGIRSCWMVAFGACVVGLLLGFAQPVAAQHAVSGRVTNPELAPISGVNVVVKGTTIGTITNVNGTFSLNAPSPQDSLVFSALGAASQTVGIAGRSSVSVVLAQQAIALEGLVVVGYGSQARELVTGSVSQITSEDIERTSATTAGDALVGKMAGINTRAGYQGRGWGGQIDPRDGRPGTPPTLQIRNMGDPLFVIDGIPREAADFNNLNAADIESVSVLKDASASVYGFRAANGVVLVTTKKGSAVERPQLRLDGYYGWQNISRELYPFGYGVTAYQQVNSVLEHEQNVGATRSRTREEMEEWRLAPTYETWPAIVNNANAPQINLNAAVSGGAGDANYYLSVGHVTQDYVQLENNFNRTNVQANMRAELFPGFSLGTEISGRVEANTNSTGTSTADPVQNFFRGVQSPHSHQEFYANGNPDFIAGNVRILQRSPPVMRRDVSGYQDDFSRAATGNFWAEYAFPFGLMAKGTYSHSRNDRQFDLQTKSFDAYCFDEARDPQYYVCAGFYGPTRRQIRRDEQGDFAQLLLNYNTQLGNHGIAATGAYEFSGTENQGSELRSVPPLNSSFLINQNDVNFIDTEWGITRRASYISRLNYDYAQRYLLEVLGRYDGSYLYDPDKRWGFFPGVSVGWRILEEPFMQGRLDFLDELKIRGSWGQAGREQGIDPWDFLGGATFGTGDGAVLDGSVVTGTRPRGLAVTNLSWVTSTMRNIGFDFAAMGGRLSGEFDVFDRVLSGIPASRYDVVLPIEVGYRLPNENLESDGNQGFDFVLRYNDQLGDVRYSISPNFTVARERTIERYKPRYGNSWDRYRNSEENRWDNLQFTYNVVGQFQSVEEVANYPVNIDGRGNSTLLPGDWIFEDVNGDNIINTLDQRPHGWGGGTPILQYGLNGSFGYGAFNLAWDVYGGSMFHHNVDNDRRVPFNADHGGAAYWNSRWRRADVFDDNSEWIPGRYPPLRKGDLSHSSYRFSSLYNTNINYLRLNRVELSFNVPTEWASRIGASQARLYTSASNPFVRQFYSQNWAQDPENGGNQIYPKSKVVNVGFSATLGGGSRSPAVVPIPPSADD